MENNNQPVKFSTNKDVVKTVYDSLKEEEKNKVENYRSRLNLLDSNSISDFGIDATGKVSNSSKALIEGAKTKDLGQASTLLLDMRDEITNFDKKSASNPVWGFIQSNTSKLKRYKNSYDSVASSLEAIKDRMGTALLDVTEKMKHYENMFNDNDETQREIMLYIIAAEKEVVAGIERLNEMYEVILKEQPESPQTHKDYYNYTILSNQIEALERRIGSMKVSRHVIQTTQPQIIMMQRASQMVSEKIRDAVSTTIPAWHRNVALAIGADEMAKTNKMLMELDKATDKLLADTSTAVNQNMIHLAKSQESSLKRVDVLKKISTDTKKTLEEMRAIVSNAANERIKVEQEMIKLENELVDLSRPQITNATQHILDKYNKEESN